MDSAAYSYFIIFKIILLSSGSNAIMPEKELFILYLDIMDLGYGVLIQRNTVDITLCVCVCFK